MNRVRDELLEQLKSQRLKIQELHSKLRRVNSSNSVVTATGNGNRSQNSSAGDNVHLIRASAAATSPRHHSSPAYHLEVRLFI